MVPPPHDFRGTFDIFFPLLTNFSSMAPTIFAKKNFTRIFIDVNDFGIIFLDGIRERNWFGLAYEIRIAMCIASIW